MLLRYLLPLAVMIVVTTSVIVIAGCSFRLPKNTGQQSVALPPANDGELARLLAEAAAQHPGLSGIARLANGAGAFATRMLLAEAATVSIDAQYYIWSADLTGYLLLDRLKKAADRGVQVRLLLDDNGTSGLDAEIAELEAHPQVEVRLWNPFTLRRFKMLSYSFDFFRLNRRMHNKSFTVDGRASVVGGRNIGDAYFDTGSNALFVDLDVLALGDVVSAISTDFDRYWNSPSAYPASLIVAEASEPAPIANRLEPLHHTEQMADYRRVLERSNLIDRLKTGALDLEWTNATLISDDPSKGQGAVPRDKRVSGRMVEAVGEIEHRFDGISPYFVPGEEGVKAFTALEKRGVKVRFMTNALEATDVLPVHAGYAKRRKSLLEGGVQLFELRRHAAPDASKNALGRFGASGASLHAKTFAVDGQRLFVGSFNFDPRSATLNTEMGILVDSKRLAESLHEVFDSGLRGAAWQVKQRNGDLIWTEPGKTPLTDEPGVSIGRKVAITIIGWLPVEWLL